MPSLNQQQKLFIVQHLACYRTPSEVSSLLKEEYGLDVKTNQIAAYDPHNLAAKSLSQELRDAFAQARQSFLVDRERVAIAQKNWRLAELEELYRDAKKRKALKLAAEFLKQAAQDDGRMFERPADKETDGLLNDLPEALNNAIEKVYGDTQSSEPPAASDAQS